MTAPSKHRPSEIGAHVRRAASARGGRGGRGGRSAGSQRGRGFSLIFAMLMLVMIGLASSAIMRRAISSGQVATNSGVQAQAQQFAQAALRFCERQLTLPASVRVIDGAAVQAPPAWTLRTRWIGSTAQAHTLAPAELSGAVLPAVAPQCTIDATPQEHVFTVTARGFGAGLGVDASTGEARAGVVVWLQSIVLVADDGGAIRQRVWQQLLTPPF